MSKCTINKITGITLFKFLRYISDKAWCVMCNWKSKSLPFHNSQAGLIYIRNCKFQDWSIYRNKSSSSNLIVVQRKNY